MQEQAVAARQRRRARRGALALALAVACSPLALPGPVGAASTTLAPEADATVREADPGGNFGSEPGLEFDTSPRTEAFVRFAVPAVVGTVTRATLRLRVENGTPNGPEVRPAPAGWGESTITWANRPAPQGGVVDDTGKLKPGSWATYDVTALVSGAGPVGFHLRPESGDWARFASRESAANPPELIIESSGSGGGGSTANITFEPVADTHAEEALPASNFGSEWTLPVQGGADPDIAAYLRFEVAGLTGVVRRATLRLWVTNGTADGPAVHRTGDAWTEETLTWANRPAPAGPAVDDAGATAKGWAEFDVTGAVPASGPVSLMLVSSSPDSFAARSSEAAAAERPQLVVETVAAPTTTVTTAPTTTTTKTSPPPTTTTTATTAPPSTTTTVPQTTTTTSVANPGAAVAEAGEPWLGLARVVTEPCAPSCARNVYTLAVADVTAATTGDQRRAFRYPPGSAASLRLEWSRTTGNGGPCAPPPAVTLSVSMRRPAGGTQIGAAVWAAAVPRTCSGVLERTVHFDADPMDGTADDADYFGVMEAYGRLSGGQESGADTRGARPTDPAARPGRYARGHLVSGGIMVGWHEDGDDPVALAANERTLGEPFGLVRAYDSTWEAPSTRIRDWMAQGRYVLWSVKPPQDPAGNLDWTPVATGAEDAVIRQQVSLLQSWAEASGTQVGYIFHHEPHDDADLPTGTQACEVLVSSDYPCAGTAAEFIDAYQRIRGVIDALGADRVQLIYTATLSRAAQKASGSSVPGSGDPMTTGPAGESVIDYVDLIAHDAYNWYCFRSSCVWEFPDDFGGWGRGVELAQAQDKQLMIAETASHPGCLDGTPGALFKCQDERGPDLPSPTRDEWLTRIGTWMESDARARRWIVGFAYYHSLHTNDWRFADQTGLTGSGQAGWRDVFTRDSVYNDGLGGHDYFTQYGFNNL